MSERIAVLDGLEAIRRRPAMYIGPERVGEPRCAQLAEVALHGFALESPTPTAIRLIALSNRAMAIVIDGWSISVAPVERHGVSHPALYDLFLTLFGSMKEASLGATCLNALSERLVVRTTQDGASYRAAFARGGLVSLLVRTEGERVGDTWMTFVPDETLVPGSLDAATGAAIVGRVGASSPNVRLTFEERTDEHADWW